ncbi:cell division protein SepF [Synechococcus sp. RSCCF101]|uniref:cell division protein SepF n=1 Tax=Synechococcus sp. RSCCF101 TaxID=2511069 RepID=UPI001244649C|nr:cell division protein SepF [Synechococcus sp. RSCCF101]
MRTPFGDWSPEIVVMTPRCFEDALDAVQAVRELKTVILNLSMLEPDMAQRAVDFVSGGVQALDGHQERVGNMVFLFAPEIVDVQRPDATEIGEPSGEEDTSGQGGALF